MTRKSKKQSNKLSSEARRIQQLSEQIKTLKVSRRSKKSTPFATTGATLGGAVGGMFGQGKLGAGIGKWLGSGIGSIFGSGDYTMAGSPPSYNVLTNGKQIPKFSSTHATNIVCHREYLGDVVGTTGFNNTIYPLNPGIASTFPWLSTIAQNYQEYKFHGVVFEFRPLITDFVTNGAPGVVVMSTNYNADAPVYVSKQEMENAEFAVSVKPTIGLMHGIECDMQQTILPQRYVRTGGIPAGQDARLYDYGNFQFATQSNPTQDLGELWVSYCVEFFKPILPVDVGGTQYSSHISRSNSTLLAPLGSTGISNTGTLSVTVDPTGSILKFSAMPQSVYLVNIIWSGTSANYLVQPITFVGLNVLTLITNNSNPYALTPLTGSTATNVSLTIIVQCTLLEPGLVSVPFVNWSLPNGYVDIFTAQLDASIA